MHKRVLFITSFAFPGHDAGATRITMLARALRSQGCEVELCGVGDATVFDGFQCKTLNPYRSNKVLNWLAYRMLGINAVSYVRRSIKRFDVVIASFLPATASREIKNICFNAGVTFAADCTEWYTPEEFSRGEKDRSYLDHVRLMTEVIDPSVKVIVISSYLERYFTKRGCTVLRVPSVLDYEALVPDQLMCPTDDAVSIMYAGSPAVKDSLWMILKAIGLLDDSTLRKLSFDFYGVGESDLPRYMSEGGALPPSVHAHGRVPRAEVIAALRKSDFTVLMRDPEKRFAQAGMPTKVTESLGCGTPVIANITSDLAEHLKDGVNSVVVDEYSAEACASAFRRAAALSSSARFAMRREACIAMRNGLDYRNYAVSIAKFLLGDK